tara:strand:- start:6935 stop:10192 length:3258 start_codon:yes stop_codon:yes gene_type:complete
MAQNGQSNQGGLANLSSVFTEDRDIKVGGAVNYIDDIHATGFTINVEATDFLGIEGSTYVNPGQMWQGTDPELQMVNNIRNIHSTGFVSNLQEGDDTLFSGILNDEFTNPGDLGINEPQAANYIINTHHRGFTRNTAPGKSGIRYSHFVGVDPFALEYDNPGSLGDILINYTQDFNAPTTTKSGTILGVTDQDFVDVIENIHAVGFTWLGPIELGNQYTTQFVGIDGGEGMSRGTFTNTGIFYEEIKNPANQSVSWPLAAPFSPGFVPGLVEGDDTLFSGILGNEFVNPGQLWESEYGALGSGVDFITNDNANGFTYLGPIEEGNIYTTQFLGIADGEYTNTGKMGFGGLNDDGYANYIEDLEMYGFTPYRAPGTGELFNSISEFIGTSPLSYENPGKGLNIHYYTNYDDDKTVDHIDPYHNQFMTGFTTNRNHLYPSEFVGVFAEDNSVRGTYENPNMLNFIILNSQQQFGLDYTSGTFTGQPEPFVHAKGFTSNIEDIIEGGVISEYHMVQPFDGGSGTIYDEMNPGSGDDFPFGNQGANNYFSNNEIDVDAVTLIQQGGSRSVDIGGTPTYGTTLKDVYNEKIDLLIDWNNVKSKTDGGLDLRAHEPFGSAYMHATMTRTPLGLNKLAELFPDAMGALKALNEPYIVRPIPNPRSSAIGTFGSRTSILEAHLEDGLRLAKYLLSPDGVKFIGTQNLIGIAAYVNHTTSLLGPRIGDASDTFRKYSSISDILVGGHQQFQYLYNPLSVFSSNIPYVKIRLNRSFGLDETTYVDRGALSNSGIGQNQNVRMAKFLNAPLNKAAKLFDKKIFGSKNPNKKKYHTALGGDLFNNVNVSIDGNAISKEGSQGDAMALAPIETKDVIRKQKDLFPDNREFESVANGFPFYFKDLRNNKLLVFRGYIEDVNENISANWSETQYIGRSEGAYAYQSTNRDINFTLKLFPNNVKELDKMYEKLDYLTGMCYPDYFFDEAVGISRPKPPLCRMRMADLYGGKPTGAPVGFQDGALGFIQSLNYTFDGPWDSVLGNGHRVPHYVIANISYKVLNDVVPALGTSMYGYGYNEGALFKPWSQRIGEFLENINPFD